MVVLLPLSTWPMTTLQAGANWLMGVYEAAEAASAAAEVGATHVEVNLHHRLASALVMTGSVQAA